MYGHYALEVTAPTRDTCDVCGGPAQFARVHDGTTLGAWCGPECAEGRRARDLRLGEEVLVSTAKFAEVDDWPIRSQSEDQLVRSPIAGFARRAVVTNVSDSEVVLSNPASMSHGTHGADRPDDAEGAREVDAPEQLRLPADFPCTRYTGVVSTRTDDSPRLGHLLERWPVDGPWTRAVSFGQWVSHQPQGMCDDSSDCEAPATLWVSYRPGAPNATDAASCERCLARRLRRRARTQAGRSTRGKVRDPVPIAFWDTTLRAWDIRPHDGSATRLA